MKNQIIAFVIGAIILGYPLMGIFTFGHAASNQNCKTAYRQECQPADHVFDGFFAGMLWPFYWSWELQEQKP